jgi:hypothetical protein
MPEETRKLHGYFFVLLFLALLVGSYFWGKQIRATYEDPGIKIKNKVPDPFRPEVGTE